MKRRKFIADQYEMPLLEERAERVEVPSRGSLLRLTGCTPAGANGVWKVISAMSLPNGGVLLGLEPPKVRRVCVGARPEQTVLSYD